MHCKSLALLVYQKVTYSYHECLVSGIVLSLDNLSLATWLKAFLLYASLSFPPLST